MILDCKPLRLTLVLALIFSAGCSVKIGPEPIALPAAVQKPVVRLGEVTETLTGTWSANPRVGTKAFQGPLLEALDQPGAAAFFLNSSSNLTLDIHLTSDHEADAPRLSNLGMLSVVTLGILPLNYFSEWKVNCDVKVSQPDGTAVADYVFHERGTYNTWVGPLTMFWLLGNGVRGDSDARKMMKQVSNNLTAKILRAIEADYPKLASKAGRGATVGPGTYAAPPKPLIT